MPERAYIVYKVSKPAPGPEVITWHGTSRNYGIHLYVEIEEYARNEVRLTYDYIQLFCFTSISRGKLRRDPVSR